MKIFLFFRDQSVSLDELEQVCSWDGPSGGVVLEGLQLEGASLMADGTLIVNTADCPDVITAPPLTIYWTTKVILISHLY